MEANQPEIWRILQERMEPAVWYEVQDLYEMVDGAIDLDDEDLEPAAETTPNQPRWQRQVRNVLQYRKDRGELEWDEEGRYRQPADTGDTEALSSETDLTVEDRLGEVLSDPPERTQRSLPPPTFKPYSGDSAASHAQRERTGRSGERFVAKYERARLKEEDYSDLAAKVEIISITEGDGLGYDVRSFDTEGNELLIEVKATTGGRKEPFYLTRNELERSRKDAERYRIYRVYDLQDEPRLFVLEPPFEEVCNMEPVEWWVTP